MTDGQKSYGFDTLMVHAGAKPDPATGARQTPIYQNTAYVFRDADHAAALFNLQEVGFIYSRLTNPTVSVLQERIATLEGGVGATCTSSGHAAQVLALFPLMSPGDNVVVSTRLYGGSITQFSQTFKRFGWEAKFVDFEEPGQVSRACTKRTKAIFGESISNPGGHVTDIPRIAKIANAKGVPLIIDNTSATPYLCQPFKMGADIVVHSTTKFINGHGTGIAGAIVCRDPALLNEKLVPVYRLYGGSGNPWDAWLVLNGLKTLSLRMERHSQNAQTVAEWLVKHPSVVKVNYPGLPGHPDEATIHAQMSQNGGMLSFELAGGTEAGMAFMNRIKFCTLTPTLGDVDTLVLHPATMSHRGVDPAVRAAHGISDGLIRLSVGIEAVEDIILDLEQAIGG
jgi:O-acetylhomoserine/O-acetylserine sulfhydrylase-like pyridoxal-dependent enzyme